MKNKLVLFVIGLLILLPHEINADENNKLVIIDGVSVWKYKDNKWYSIDYDNGNNDFNVYIDNNYYGTYQIKKENKYILYDKNNGVIPYNGHILAISSNLNINAKPYTLKKVEEKDMIEINDILNSRFKYYDFSLNEYAVVDLDNNGVNDKIVSVSNLDSDDEQSKYVNLVYIKLNNSNIQILINDEVEVQDLLKAPIYNIRYILNIDNNNNYNSIVLQEGYFSDVGKTTNILYEYQNGAYNMVEIGDEKKNNNSGSNKKDYTMYIFSGILLIATVIGYLIYSIIKKKGNSMDV